MSEPINRHQIAWTLLEIGSNSQADSKVRLDALVAAATIEGFLPVKKTRKPNCFEQLVEGKI